MSKTSSRSAKKTVKISRPAESSHKRIVAAAGVAVRRTLKQHKALGTPIVVWRNGKVVRLTADKIKL